MAVWSAIKKPCNPLIHLPHSESKVARTPPLLIASFDILNIGLDYVSYKNNEIDKTEFHENLTIDIITPIASEGTKIYFISSGATAIEAAAAGGIIGLTIGAYYGLYRWFKPIAQEWNWQFNNWIQNMTYNLNNPAYYP